MGKKPKKSTSRLFYRLTEKVREAFLLGNSRGYQRGRLVDLTHYKGDIIIVGDLHQRLDNLEKILSHNNNERCIYEGTRILLLLGDLVHPEHGSLSNMKDSFSLLERVWSLKTKAPLFSYVLAGNHDFLDKSCAKHDAHGRLYRQSEIFERELKKRFGDHAGNHYKEVVQEYGLLAKGVGFCAAHAGPALSFESVEFFDNLLKTSSEGLQKILFEKGELSPDGEKIFSLLISQELTSKKIPLSSVTEPVVREAVWGRFGQTFGVEEVTAFLHLIGGGTKTLLFCGHTNPLYLEQSKSSAFYRYEETKGRFTLIFSANDQTGYAFVQDGVPEFITL